LAIDAAALVILKPNAAVFVVYVQRPTIRQIVVDLAG
jgi:hypothetical protein